MLISVDKDKVKNLVLLNKMQTKGNPYIFDNRYVGDDSGNVYLIKSIGHRRYVVAKMNPFITYNGYVEYVLTDAIGYKKHIQAHRIVAGLYLKKDKLRIYVNHIDGVRTNNTVGNLEYVTHSENIQHSFDKLGKIIWNKGKIK